MGQFLRILIIYRVLVSKVWQLIGDNVSFSWTQGHSHDTIRLDSCHCPYRSWVKKLSFPNLFTIYRYTLIETAWALTQALHKSLWQCPWTTLFYTNLCRKGATKGIVTSAFKVFAIEGLFVRSLTKVYWLVCSCWAHCLVKTIS